MKMGSSPSDPSTARGEPVVGPGRGTRQPHSLGSLVLCGWWPDRMTILEEPPPLGVNGGVVVGGPLTYGFAVTPGPTTR